MEYITLCKDHAEDRMQKGGKLVRIEARPDFYLCHICGEPEKEGIAFVFEATGRRSDHDEHNIT